MPLFAYAKKREGIERKISPRLFAMKEEGIFQKGNGRKASLPQNFVYFVHSYLALKQKFRKF